MKEQNEAVNNTQKSRVPEELKLTFLTAALYGVFAFYNLETNPLLWDWFSRLFILIILGAPIVFGIVVYTVVIIGKRKSQ